MAYVGIKELTNSLLNNNSESDETRTAAHKLFSMILKNIIENADIEKYRKLSVNKLSTKLSKDSFVEFTLWLIKLGFVQEQANYVLPMTADLTILRECQKYLLTCSPINTGKSGGCCDTMKGCKNDTTKGCNKKDHSKLVHANTFSSFGSSSPEVKSQNQVLADNMKEIEDMKKKKNQEREKLRKKIALARAESANTAPAQCSVAKTLKFGATCGKLPERKERKGG